MTSEKKQFWIILLIVFLAFLGSSMPYLIFPALFLSSSYAIFSIGSESALQAIFLGMTLCAYPLGQFIGSPILGALSDDYGRKKLLWASLLIASAANLISGISIAEKNLWLLIASRFIAGLMEGNVAIARAMAVDLKTLSKHKTFGKINASASIAFILGPLLGGVMADANTLESWNLTPSTPFYFIALLFLGLAGISFLLLKDLMLLPKTKKQTLWRRFNVLKSISSVLSSKRIKSLILISTAFTLAVDIFYEFSPVYLTVKWNLSPADLIVYNAVLCVGLAVGNGCLPSFFSTPPSIHRAIFSSFGAFGLFLMIMLFTGSPGFMIFLFGVSGIVIGVAVTLVTIKISDSASDQIQGEVMGIQLSLRVLGDALICILGGSLLILSSKAILILASILSFSTFLYSLYKKK